MNVLLLELFLCVVIGGIVWLLVIRPRAREKEQFRSPFTERILRPPGESLRRKIRELDDKIDDWLMWLFVPPAAAIGCAVGENSTSGFGVRTLGFTWAAIFVSLAFAFRIRVLLRERANYRLGFEGEQQTAQHLLPLIADGCRVFHDILLENTNGKSSNIDHVAVGPTGIFAIETKTRSKLANRKVNEVNYDGKMLHFPGFSESDSLEQVKGSSARLGKELSRRAGENLRVVPILTLPGWWINRQVGNAEIAVLNSKEIRRHINSMPRAGFKETTFSQIIGFLEEKTEMQPSKTNAT